MEKRDELIFDVAELEERRGVVAVLTLCAAAFFLVACADEAKAVLDGLEVKGLVADAFGTELFEGAGQLFGL